MTFMRQGSLWGLGLLIVCCGALNAARAGMDATVDGSTDPSQLGKFRNTYYYLLSERSYLGQPINDKIMDMDDHVIANVNHKFRRAVDIEGSGKLLNGQVFNFAGVKNGRIRYRLTSAPFGNGVGTCNLIPFHTIAVDPKRIPLGSVVRIAETVGMKLPDGSIHDGLWRAEDVGSAIKRYRIDLFVGEGNQGAVLDAQHIDNMQALTVTLVTPPVPGGCTQQRAP